MIAENLARVQQRIEAAAGRVGRDPTEITLVGVTKQQTVETMLAGYRAGLRHFGENRVEEIVAKAPRFLEEVDQSDPPIIHMIGHLQRRKVAGVLQYSTIVHSVDTARLAERISRLAQEPLTILLECNISGEASKAGFSLTDWEDNQDRLDNFLIQIQTISRLSNLQLAGLMTMAPFVADAAETRPCFRRLHDLRQVCAERFPDINWQHLSMGMTNDFEVAIEEGATMVRVGRAIFPR